MGPKPNLPELVISCTQNDLDANYLSDIEKKPTILFLWDPDLGVSLLRVPVQ